MMAKKVNKEKKMEVKFFLSKTLVKYLNEVVADVRESCPKINRSTVLEVILVEYMKHLLNSQNNACLDHRQVTYDVIANPCNSNSKKKKGGKCSSGFDCTLEPNSATSWHDISGLFF